MAISTLLKNPFSRSLKPLDVEAIRQDFPTFQKGNELHGKQVIYMDSACMALKPKQVIDAINDYYRNPACAGRSHHALSGMVEERVEASRKSVAKFFNVATDDFCFTRNASEAINLVAQSFPFAAGDKVLTLDKEHNSNLLPWQKMAKVKGIKHVIVNTTHENTFDWGDFRKKLPGARLVAFGHSSNLDGVSIPAEQIVKEAHEAGALVLFDGAQYAPHHALDLKRLGADYYAVSFHKMLGPTGMGALFGTKASLALLAPFLVGGGTVKDSTYTTSEFETSMERFEAGLQDYAGIFGVGAALDYLAKIGPERIASHEAMLNARLTELLTKEIADGKIALLGPRDAQLRAGIFSFVPKTMDVHELAMLLSSSENIMIRSGRHCVHSYFNARSLSGSDRASFYCYNTVDEINLLASALKRLAH